MSHVKEFLTKFSKFLIEILEPEKDPLEVICK